MNIKPYIFLVLIILVLADKRLFGICDSIQK